MSFATWRCGRFDLNLAETNIMGVLNCTPDSFSDGGKFLLRDQALEHAEKMIAAGVDILDIGAESTRPGSKAISAAEEIARLTPVVSALVKNGHKPISVDTKKTEVMAEMLKLGVDMINDVHGFEDAGAVELLAKHDAALCIMHMRGMPENMQENTAYADVVAEVDQYLQQRVAVCMQAGIDPSRIVLDPGFGFGKTPAQNMQLVKHCQQFSHDRFPVLLGVSRKSTIGHFLDHTPVENRLVGSVTLAALGAFLGANIVRVHDVTETRDALKMVAALQK